MIQFYAPDIEVDNILPEEESGHCCRVLRMKVGDEIRVTDGRGMIFYCRILKAHSKHTEIEIIGKEELPQRNYKLTLAVAPTKNSDRIEWMVEKAVEIGIEHIVLLKCSRSERKALRTDRLRRIMVSAMNQSLEAYLPTLSEVTSFDDFVKSQANESQKFFGYCSEAFPRKELVKECRPGRSVSVMIGPEGDFSPEEVENAIRHGFLPVTFGDKRLRTETAGVFATCAVNIINQLAD
ncbi:MAG: 16S rRNA (uracil(1498)-N(3))-methyltransferase [Muribaculaceae bacterium]|nr:16S rRNA (uracil(1498)-N(3))-methyltransferase [Muribaculaceae bacterium]